MTGLATGTFGALLYGPRTESRSACERAKHVVADKRQSLVGTFKGQLEISNSQ